MDRVEGQAGAKDPVSSERDPADPDAGVWIFAYGSLMWRPGFRFRASCHARLQGYHRSLCIYSWVHRGTRERPGLVFGLDRGGACKGFAFQVAQADAAGIIAYLDERELVTDVYRRKCLPILTDRGRFPAWCYVVRREHPQYAGRLPEAELLDRVRHSEGVSGHNRDYLLSTVRHLEEMGVIDVTLKGLVKRLEGEPASRIARARLAEP